MAEYTMKVSFDTGATAAQLNAAVSKLKDLGIEAISVNSKLTATSQGFRTLGENTISFKTQVTSATARTNEFGEILKKLNATGIQSTTVLAATEAATRRLALAEIQAYQQEAKINAARLAANEKQRMATLSAIQSSQRFQQSMHDSAAAESHAANTTSWLGTKLSSIIPSFDDFGAVLYRVGLRLSAYATFAAAAAVAGAPLAALKAYGDFEEKMRNVQAASGATDEEIKRLGTSARAVALEMRRFNATEVAEGLYSLASAGYTAEEQLKSIRPVMLFAAAAQADLALSSELVVSTLKIFGKGAEDAMSVADTMAASIAKTALTAERLSYAMRNAGPSAAAYGQTVTGTVAALGALVDKFNSGEKAGTGLATLFKQMEIHQKELGVAVLDSAGHMRPLVDIIQSLEEKGVSAQKVLEILGRGAGPALAALLRTGSTALRELEAGIQSSGQAGQIAGKQLDAFKNQVKEIGSNVSDMMIELGEALASGMSNKQGGIVSVVQEMSFWIKENKKDIAEFGSAFVSVATFTVKAGADILGLFSDIAIVIKDIVSDPVPALILLISGGLVAATVAYGTIADAVWIGIIGLLELATAAATKYTAAIVAADAAMAANPIGIVVAALAGLGLALHKAVENSREWSGELIQNEVALASTEKAMRDANAQADTTIDKSIKLKKAYIDQANATLLVLEAELARLAVEPSLTGNNTETKEYKDKEAAIQRLSDAMSKQMVETIGLLGLKRMQSAMAQDEKQDDQNLLDRMDEKKEADRIALENLKATQREFKALLNALLPVQKAEKDLAEWQAKKNILVGAGVVSEEQYALVIESLKSKIVDLTDEEERRAKILALGQNGEQKKALQEEIDAMGLLTAAYAESVTAGNQAKIMLEREKDVRQAIGKELRENANDLASQAGDRFDAARAAAMAESIANLKDEADQLDRLAQAYRYSAAAGEAQRRTLEDESKAASVAARGTQEFADALVQVQRARAAQNSIDVSKSDQETAEKLLIISAIASVHAKDYATLNLWNDARQQAQKLQEHQIRQQRLINDGKKEQARNEDAIFKAEEKSAEAARKKAIATEKYQKEISNAKTIIGSLIDVFGPLSEGFAKLAQGIYGVVDAMGSMTKIDENSTFGDRLNNMQAGGQIGSSIYSTGIFGDGGGGIGLLGAKMKSDSSQMMTQIGGMVGSIWGPVGSVVGSLIGGAIGSAMKHAAEVVKGSLTLATSSIESATANNYKLVEPMRVMLDNIKDQFFSILDSIDAEVVSLGQIDFTVTGDVVEVVLDGISQKFKSLDDAMEFAIKQSLRTGSFSGLSANEQAAINFESSFQGNNRDRTLDDLKNSLNLAQIIDHLGISEIGVGLIDQIANVRAQVRSALEIGFAPDEIGKLVNQISEAFADARAKIENELGDLAGTSNAVSNAVYSWTQRVNDLLQSIRDYNRQLQTQVSNEQARAAAVRASIATQEAALRAAREAAARLAAAGVTGRPRGPRTSPEDGSTTPESAADYAAWVAANAAIAAAEESIARLTAELGTLSATSDQTAIDIEASITAVIRGSQTVFDDFASQFLSGPVQAFDRQMDQFADYVTAANDVYAQNMRIATTDEQRAEAARVLDASLTELVAAQAAYQQSLKESTTLSILETIARHTNDPAVALRISQIKWRLELANLYAQLALLDALDKKVKGIAGGIVVNPGTPSPTNPDGSKSGTNSPVQTPGQSDSEWLRQLIDWLAAQGPGDTVTGGKGGGGGRKEARKNLQEELADAMRPVEGQWATEVRNWAEQGQKWIEEAKKAGVSLADVAKATEAMRLKLAASAKEDIAEKLKPSSAAGKAMMDLMKWKKDMEDAAKALGLSLADIDAAYKAAFARIVAQVHMDVREYANVGGRDDLGIALLKNKQQADDLRDSLNDLAKKGVDVSKDLKAVALAEARRAKMLKQQARIDFFTDLAGMLKDGADKTWLLHNATRMKYIMELGMLKAQFAILNEMGIFTTETALRIQGILDGLPATPGADEPIDTRQQQVDLFTNIAGLLDDGIDKTWLLENAQQIKYDLEVANLKLQLQILEAAHAFAPEVLARLHGIIDNLPADLPVPDVEKEARDKFKSLGNEISDLGDSSGGLAGRFRDLKQKNEDLVKKIHESGLGLGRQAELMKELAAATDFANKSLIAQSTADLMEGLAGYVDNEIDKTWLLQNAAQIKYDMEIAQMLVQLSILEAQADITDQQRKDYERIHGLILGLPKIAPNVNAGGGGVGNNQFDDARALIDSLRGMITQAIPGVAGQFAALDAEFQSIREQAAALNLDLYLGPGGGAALIDEAYGARVQALWNQILQPLSDFVDSLDLSDLSPLTPQQRLDLARAKYEETAAAALAGDADAAAALAQVSQQYLQEAQGLGTATSAYGAIFAQVQQVANQILAMYHVGNGSDSSVAGSTLAQASSGVPYVPGLSGVSILPQTGMQTGIIADIFGAQNGQQAKDSREVGMVVKTLEIGFNMLHEDLSDIREEISEMRRENRSGQGLPLRIGPHVATGAQRKGRK